MVIRELFEHPNSSDKCMDGREAMALSGGSPSYYIHRGGFSGPGLGNQTASLHSTQDFRPFASSTIPTQPNARCGSVGPAFSVESSQGHYSLGINVGVSAEAPASEPVRKKRGRPRKYVPDEPVSLGLSPMSVTSNQNSGQNSVNPKRPRGRPPGSGRKQQLALLGEWMDSSAGQAFAPHVMHIGAGVDIVARILSFSQQKGRAVCIMSGNGTVSSMTLRQPASSEVGRNFEGRFQILCLSGSYLVSKDGAPQNRTGGVSVSLASPDGQVIGGAVDSLIAAAPVQVIISSFVYGGSKTKKNKQVAGPKSEDSSEPQPSDELAPQSTTPDQTYTPSTTGFWAGSRPDLENPHSGIDLRRG